MKEQREKIEHESTKWKRQKLDNKNKVKNKSKQVETKVKSVFFENKAKEKWESKRAE